MSRLRGHNAAQWMNNIVNPSLLILAALTVGEVAGIVLSVWSYVASWRKGHRAPIYLAIFAIALGLTPFSIVATLPGLAAGVWALAVCWRNGARWLVYATLADAAMLLSIVAWLPNHL